MNKTKLTPSRIGRLRPKPKEYHVWDSITPHFGVRVMPTGAMRFIHLAPKDGRLTKITIGDVERLSLDEARAIAYGMNVGEKSEETKPICPTFAERVSLWEAQAYARIKPATKRGYQHYLNRQLLPAFGGKRLDAISRTAILAWFENHSRKAPGNANKALSLLGSILGHAKTEGLIQINPVDGIPHNPGSKGTRFLSVEERERLLSALEETPKEHRAKALVVKLLLLTGCRRNEILALRWKEVGEGVLNLKDSKTGARTVWLSDDAIAALDEARSMTTVSGKRSGSSEFVFPAPSGNGEHLHPRTLYDYWFPLRSRVGFPDVRIHDLRHSFASEAIRQGVSLPVVSKLLGHSQITMTMRYVHASNVDVEDAAERIACQIASKL